MIISQYFISIYISGVIENVENLIKKLDSINDESPVFKALLESIDKPTSVLLSEIRIENDVNKVEYNRHAPNEVYVNFICNNMFPQLILKKLSAAFLLTFDIEYDCKEENIAGKVILNDGALLTQQVYNFLEGKYVLDIEVGKNDFWAEVEVLIEDAYFDEEEDISDILSKEMHFLNEKEKKRFVKLYSKIMG